MLEPDSPRLPADPVLAAWASTLDDGGHWAHILDASWRYVFQTEELRKTFADMGAPIVSHVGLHYFSQEATEDQGAAIRVPWGSRELRRAWFQELGPYVLSTMPGGRDELRGVVHPELLDLVDDLEPRAVPHAWVLRPEWTTAGADIAGESAYIRIDDGDRVAGICILSKPAAGMSHLGVLAAMADLAHLERMHTVERPDRRPAAILMADLEGSSHLARRLSTAQFFAFGRRLVRAADRSVVDAGGIVGRHAGDGVVAFFLAETAGGESPAASSCIRAARSLRSALPEIATRSSIPDSEVSLRFGLHWGATLYMGRILTAGRSEVTALGDEVNEAARIEACATGGRTLGSKALIERLNHTDAANLGIDPGHMTYKRLGDLDTATDKARRDTPDIAVCEIDGPVGSP